MAGERRAPPLESSERLLLCLAQTPWVENRFPTGRQALHGDRQGRRVWHIYTI